MWWAIREAFIFGVVLPAMAVGHFAFEWFCGTFPGHDSGTHVTSGDWHCYRCGFYHPGEFPE